MQRSRRIAAVFAVVALTLSLAETVWASTCAPMSASPAVAAQEAGHSADCPAKGHDEGSEHPGGEEPHCPFAPVVTPGCVAAASLPTSSSVPTPPAVEAEVTEPAAAAAADLLLGAALFRPPRA
ncbi:MAG TPA: hypothetical protein VMM12_05595 [Longimicrobiales bacterium]|nr:hypothetical protein [Longimicrobiales bacterium]